MVYLSFHNASDLPVPFGAAPNVAFRPYRKLAQFVNSGMIVACRLVRQRKVRRIKDTCLGSKQPKQASRLLNAEARERALAKRPVEQENARRRLIVSQPRRWAVDDEPAIESREVIRIGQGSNTAHAGFSRLSGNSTPAATWAASAPAICAAMKAGTQDGAMPANVSLSERARVMAGLAKLVDEVNQ